jgi:branched-subunit amino acid ABC-type transport system permease component
LNFAHGDVFMVGSFIGFGVLQLLGGTAKPVVPVWLLLVRWCSPRWWAVQCSAS